jgi:hypothetical protein
MCCRELVGKGFLSHFPYLMIAKSLIPGIMIRRRFSIKDS